MAVEEKTLLIWIDLEMDGLDLTKNYILEIACIVTDVDIKIVHEGPNIVIHHPKSLLDEMNSWCMTHHTNSGLVQKVLNSKISMNEAENEIIRFIETKLSKQIKQRLILAGNSVYVDRYFLEKDMPRLNSMLDQTILDCSTIKELINRFNYSIYQQAPYKSLKHRALEDIQDSIKEYQYYKEYAFEEKCQTYKIDSKQSTRKDQYLIWVNICSNGINCILTDNNLNIIDEIIGGKTDADLMNIFFRNRIVQNRTIVVAGKHLGPIRYQLNKRVPKFNEFCHYRSIDIDVVSFLCETWFPNMYKQRPISDDENNDLKHSIKCLQFYRSTIFK